MKADGIALALEHDTSQIVVEQDSRQTIPTGEGLDVAVQEALEALIEEKAQEDPAREAQHHDEGHERPTGAPDREVAKMSPVDLALLTGQGAQTQIGLGLGARAMAADDVAEVIGTAAIAALADHGVEPAGSQCRELLECRKNEREIRVDVRGSRAAQARQAGPSQHPGDGAVMDVELPGDGIGAPSLDVVIDPMQARRTEVIPSRFQPSQQRIGDTDGSPSSKQ